MSPPAEANPNGTLLRDGAEPPRGAEAVRRLLRAFFRIFHFTQVEGRENIPPEGPVLFAANHQSYYDPPLIACEQDGWIRSMAWEALFRHRWFGKFIRRWGAFPVDVKGRDPGGYRECLKLLRDGQRIMIFPEGGRSFDGSLLPLREGAARLAMSAEAPIVPVRITGASHAWPRGDLAPKPWFPIRLRFGEPIYPRSADTPEERKAESARIMEELRKAIDPEIEIRG